MRTIRRAAVAAATAVAVLFAVPACGPAGGADRASGLPRSWDELKGWRFEDWDNWASKHVFHNPETGGVWSPETMGDAAPQQPAPPAVPPSATAGPESTAATGSAVATGTTAAPTATASGATVAPTPSTGPAPAVVQAVAVPRPYTRYAASGKVFMTAPNGGTGQCSATVVADPAHPGRSNLVWTAAHCVHEGQGGDWFKNIIFVPAYNSSGAAGGGRRATLPEVAPLGQWWADKVITSPQWTAEGGHSGNAANQYDFAVLRVHDPANTERSLEETVGTAVPVWFDAPRDELTVSAWGYPAVRPFDGQELDRCDSGRPGQLSFDPKRPAMLTIGCTMTAGASGGGWFATTPDGRQALVSNTSIGNLDHTSLNGPYLESVARQALDYLSKK
ncbi:trypsin-like peptidase domain-containing protein [Kitasatospora sp. NBC_00374]|uniref:trypsin-like serine peptidase n=1 Tax=Kitasatospora sp. NBC_00374 TaxID=2975964 RepID=UPI0030E4BA4F